MTNQFIFKNNEGIKQFDLLKQITKQYDTKNV